MRLIDADRLLDRCIFYHLPNGDLAVPIIDVQHAPTVEAPDINVGNMDTTTHDSIPVETGGNDEDRTSGDCISRRASLEKIRKMQTYKLFSGDDMILINKAQVQTELMMLPSAQPERKTGHWVKSDMQRWYDVWLCSECGEKTDSSVMSEPRYKYCPMCGAKMEGGEQT